MNLHENEELFRDAVTITAQHMHLPEIYIEKDYWVTLALERIFKGPLAEFTIFKGGTALSKCFTYINRFSEDIDLVVMKQHGVSSNQLKDRLKQISSSVAEWLPEVEVPGITNKKGMIRKTAHTYSKVFLGDFGPARDVVILESSWLGSSEPAVLSQVNSFIYQMMAEKGQAEIAREYGLLPFEVSILAPTRTMCEKIMSLVRFSYTEKPILDLRNKIRHVYDLHQLLGQEDIAAFFESSGFDEMLHKVAQEDELSFRNNKDWLYNHPREALIFSEIDTVWAELMVTYNGPFKTLVFGELPDPALVKKTLLRISDRLSSVEWRRLKSAE
ncbi:nucleotidyltransferase AbiEii toxin of type IV toxin-antitoxin system [Dyadobacter jejuensis]|uniref:Nucleotidyltransferase AbiEii toxin of type IV toxin-antitoxin system n=1 Tax=Dyadobacter jejuensis TaxID=1082580 RepID=A0A316AUK4_9BACT|nr:nucleotidyl transferase AbiEii/AbiGii toxin family protein [Dyadobacter jejuensis]PWJ60370.1 nucleotidyltransferase AbiEii toxin of type IV toxin-antitoxin system [Dyadobacter jejuensis]